MIISMGTCSVELSCHASAGGKVRGRTQPCTYHRFAASFGTTHGVAYASFKLMLRHLNTDVFVSALRVVRALLRENRWWLPLKCVPDHTATFRVENGDVSAPSGMENAVKWD